MKSYFTKPLTVTKLKNQRWRVRIAFAYYTQRGEIIKIPRGFITDLASIPRPFWSVIGSPGSGDYAQAAVVHDYLYVEQTFTRKQSDKIFLEAMRDLRVGWLRRTVMYIAVRIGGRIPWENYKLKT